MGWLNKWNLAQGQFSVSMDHTAVINLAPKYIIGVDTERSKEKTQTKLYLANAKNKKAGATMLMPDKADFETKSNAWDMS